MSLGRAGTWRITIRGLFHLSGGRAFLYRAIKRDCDWPPRRTRPVSRRGRVVWNKDRDEEIARRARNGWLYREIGKVFKLRVQRVQQIVTAAYPEKGWKRKMNRERRTA